MYKRIIRLLWAGCVASSLIATAAAAEDVDQELQTALAGPLRIEANKSRDPARHPYEMLHFFGLRPDMSVVEIWPGGGYWTETLAPYLRAQGQYVVAIGEGKKKFLEKLHGAEAYDRVKPVDFADGDGELGPAGSIDLVVTFRNLHDWLGDGTAETVLQSIHTVLKPGGVLGIEDHRGRDDVPQDPKAASGYVRQDYAINLIEKAGFRHLADSEIAANPRDTKDYPAGVWTLPPTLRLGASDRDRYLAIGESDRFVMTFQKLP